MTSLRTLASLAVSVSRMRFWIYTGGTYVVGYALVMESWLAFFWLEYTLSFSSRLPGRWWFPDEIPPCANSRRHCLLCGGSRLCAV
ncbi:MAG: hypothetical protein U9N40_03455 [Euryarchaeota archaeon]|nr:hypothetical protein [Euryarchaeota archaeon]